MKLLLKLSATLYMISTLSIGCKSTQQPYVVEIRSTGYSMGNDYYRAYYNGDLRMYEYHIFTNSKITTIDTVTMEPVPVQITQAVQTRYFVFHKDSIYGYKFEQQVPMEKNPARLRVDSILKMITIQSGDLETATLQMQPDTIEWSGGRTICREVYVVKAQNGFPGFVRNLYYSKKLNYIEESFSKKLDSARQMKLYKVEAKMAELYNSTNSIGLPPVVSNEIIVIPMPDSGNTDNYFNVYRKITAEHLPQTPGQQQKRSHRKVIERRNIVMELRLDC